MTVARSRAVGLFFSVVGLSFLSGAALNLNMGTLAQMGGGFFPALIASLLIGFGVAVFFSPDTTRVDLSDIPWRGIFCVCAAVVIFATTVRSIGFVASTALLVLISSLASRRMSLKLALLLCAVITATATLIFIYGLGLSFRL